MRTLDHKFFEEIANDPAIRPQLGGEGALSFAAMLASANNYAFKNECGGYIVHNLMPGMYECHSLFRKEPKGFGGIRDLMRQSLEYMFVQTDCQEIVTRVPETYRGAELLAKMGGFQSVGTQSNWDGDKTATVMSLTLDTWARACSSALEAGHKFHQLLEGAKSEAKSQLPIHQDDPLHDRMVGAAIMMVKAGNVAKGLNFYNHWAMQFGYAGISLASEQPIVVDVQDALVTLVNGQVEVLSCR